MIAFRIEAASLAPIFEENNEANAGSFRAKTGYISKLNAALLDIFEESDILWMQVAEMDTPSTLLMYAAYTPLAAEKGKVDSEEDILRMWERLSAPASITLTLIEEISAIEFNRAMQRHDLLCNSRVRDMCAKKLFSDFAKYDTYGYKVSDRLAPVDYITSKATAKTAIKRLLPDDSMIKEVDRIFCNKHPKHLFYGIPVHYKISTKSDIIADEMIDSLVNCLYLNRRILSRRITKIDNIEDRRWDKDNLLKMFRCSQNSVIEIMLNGDVATEQEYASQYHQVSDILAENIKEFSGNILFFFVENSSHPGFAKQLLGKIDDELDIIEIQEGVGNAKQASAYFKNLLAASNMECFFENEVVFERGKFYSTTEVRTRFNQWRKERLRDRVYSAYSHSPTIRIEKAIREKGSAFHELQRMVGLTEVKAVIVDIIAAFKVQKLRNKYYDSNDAITKHMIFTGKG